MYNTECSVQLRLLGLHNKMFTDNMKIRILYTCHDTKFVSETQNYKNQIYKKVLTGRSNKNLFLECPHSRFDNFMRLFIVPL